MPNVNGTQETPTAVTPAAPETANAQNAYAEQFGAVAETPPAQPVAPPAQPVDGTPPASVADWTTALPEGMRKVFDGVQTPEEAARIIERGKSYNPAEKPEDITLQWGDGVQVHAGLEAEYKQFCVAEGVTPAQAQKLIAFEQAINAKMIAEQQAAGEAQLVAQFGNELPKVKQKALEAFTALDRQMAGRLSASHGGQEIANNALMIEALYHMSAATSEERIGNGSAAPGAATPKTTEERYAECFQRS